MSAAQTTDPAVFGPCNGLIPDVRLNTCANFASEYVVWVALSDAVDDDTIIQGTWMRRLCTPCADLVGNPMERRPLKTTPGGYPIPATVIDSTAVEAAPPRPVNVAVVDAEMADAAETLDDMVESYRRGSVEFNVDAAARYLLMSRATVDTYDHFEAAKLLAVAVARLGDAPALSGDLFTEDVSPAHAVESIGPDGTGSCAGVCVCGWAATGFDYDEASELLDTHIEVRTAAPAAEVLP